MKSGGNNVNSGIDSIIISGALASPPWGCQGPAYPEAYLEGGQQLYCLYQALNGGQFYPGLFLGLLLGFLLGGLGALYLLEGAGDGLTNTRAGGTYIWQGRTKKG